MKPNIGRELQSLPIPPAFNAHVKGGPRRNIAMTFGRGKTRMVWLPVGEKNLKI